MAAASARRSSPSSSTSAATSLAMDPYLGDQPDVGAVSRSTGQGAPRIPRRRRQSPRSRGDPAPGAAARPDDADARRRRARGHRGGRCARRRGLPVVGLLPDDSNARPTGGSSKRSGASIPAPGCRTSRRPPPTTRCTCCATSSRGPGPDREAVRRALAGVGSATPPFEGVTGTVAFDAAGDVPNQNVYIGLVRERSSRARRAGGDSMILRSLRSRVLAGMVLLLVLVFVIALLGRELHPRARPLGEPGAVAPAREHRARATAWCPSSRPRSASAEQYLVRPDERLRWRCSKRATRPTPTSGATAPSARSRRRTATSSTRSRPTRPRSKSPTAWPTR